MVNPGTHMTRAMYACPNIHTEQRLARSDTNTPGFMRAPNEMQTFFALESAVDELAMKLAMDPIELRRVNDARKHPVEGVPFSSRSLMACFDSAAASFGWARRSAAPRSMTDGDWQVGYGCATSTYPTAMAPSSARVRMYGAGTAVVELAAHDVGTGTYTILGQIAAQRLGLPVGAVEVLHGRLGPAAGADLGRLGDGGQRRLGGPPRLPGAGRRGRAQRLQAEGQPAVGRRRGAGEAGRGRAARAGRPAHVAARRAEGHAARRGRPPTASTPTPS